jgi:hypothetical protein
MNPTQLERFKTELKRLIGGVNMNDDKLVITYLWYYLPHDMAMAAMGLLLLCFTGEEASSSMAQPAAVTTHRHCTGPHVWPGKGPHGGHDHGRSVIGHRRHCTQRRSKGRGVRLRRAPGDRARTGPLVAAHGTAVVGERRKRWRPWMTSPENKPKGWERVKR